MFHSVDKIKYIEILLITLRINIISRKRFACNNHAVCFKIMETICLELHNSSSKLLNDSPPHGQVVSLTKDEQREMLLTQYQQCMCKMYTEPVQLEGVFCNRTWDNIMCWDDTSAGTTAFQRCPGYINSFTMRNFASRTCLTNGSWLAHPSVNGSRVNGWTNYSACQTRHVEDSLTGGLDQHNVPRIFMEHFEQLQLMYNIGYATSLISLIVALGIMVFFRKLRCSRNTIHLNLFASFILRAAISLIKDNFMVKGLGFPIDVTQNETADSVVFNEGSHFSCRLFFAIFYYSVACSYIWIFIEAAYLHMLIFISVFTERVKIKWFILFGWLFPVTFIGAWCIAKYRLDNHFCWNINRPGLVWIIHGPIMISVVLNFISFISIIRVLYTKLASNLCPDSKKHRYRKLARSTLFLVPTFGVYFILFAIPITGLSETLDFVHLFIEMFFNSFQGFFIALMLCFVNAEVRVQIKRQLEDLGFLRHSIKSAHRTDYLRTQYTKREEAVGGMEEEEMELQCGIADLRPAKQTIIGDEKEMQPFMQPFSYSNCESGYV
ncbi:secretin receptor-like isoform X2 [Dreissena polymorpha]|uniref:secretin receptor-like isoform X2 n=1 Tax=Dreissena polymorpha TaxID=45954 RepID=UPI002264DE24|nr:secretin receptor-like isoform X2 [Dreissena polymorpha]